MNETVAHENAEKVPGWNLLSKAATESLRVQALTMSPHVAQTVDMAQIASTKSASHLALCQQFGNHHSMQHLNAHRLQIVPLSLSMIMADNVVVRDSLHALAQ